MLVVRPNAAPKWQARCLGGVQRGDGGLSTRGVFDRPLRLSQQLFKFIPGEINIPQYLY